MWNNTFLKVENKTVFYKTFFEKGIKYVEDIYNRRSNRFYNFEELQNMYDINNSDF